MAFPCRHEKEERLALTDPMKMIILDHLPCQNNQLGLCTGATIQGVSEFGHTLSEYVHPEDLESGSVDAIFSSQLPRALETVELCFGEFDLPKVVDPRIRAFDYGMHQSSPMPVIVELQMDHISTPFEDGESFNSFLLNPRAGLTQLSLPSAANRTFFSEERQ